MKTKKSIAKKHTVRANLRNFLLVKAGASLNLEIRASRRKLGELIVGRGSLYWYGRFKQKPKRIDWSKFAEMMDRLAEEG